MSYIIVCCYFRLIDRYTLLSLIILIYLLNVNNRTVKLLQLNIKISIIYVSEVYIIPQ